MNVREIGQINEAILVLRHFIDLSANLLPFLDELQRKRNPSIQERINKNRIMDVYESYKFDTNTSEVLINSNVLELIRDSYAAIKETDYHHRSHGKSRRILRQFLIEHARLREEWLNIDAN